MNHKREEIQKEAMQAIVDSSFVGYIDVSPRVGKSKIVIDAMNLMYNKEISILITAPFNSILESWQKEFIKWKLSKHINISVINQRSLEKVNLEDYDVLICDEVHSLSSRQLEVIANQSFLGLLGLSGSVSSDTSKKLRKELDLHCIYEYSIEQAIEDGIIADYEILLVPIALDNKVAYIEAGNKAKRFMTTEKKNYDYLTKSFDKFRALAWKRKELEPVKMSFASKRANLIYTSKTKIEATKKILAKLDRTLVFTARTKVAEELGDKSYHSKSTEDTLTQFFNEEFSKLGVCEMTNMGITFPNLKVGVFHQLRSSEESAIQKVLRMCNLEEDVIAKIIIVYYENTKDEEWVIKATTPFDPNKVKKIRLNNLLKLL